ncbi:MULTISPECIES: hypothetical protein [unclassified Rhodococcus (in: high G+C Gram-positive bacteria)]|uniref:hypothetical protein n=1 Tax=unclassified Rhodococcus (in: high G+C Gram-positive bacteria) TaxID=192944 RepID=UPI0007BBC4F1|nr:MULTISPECIES: hypothetical protein [unclassified Rhodococcus (in: high G+C Gram-positive bacteria)]KZF06773.1 hypothetical protein A2J02_00350 [Rhodococcus sp. EPR-147]KZF08625.1 hypothetical protein A2J04_00860 [Rhodococcus sp. EPR-279]MDI6626272.1 hypothetical protein [Rhodococcus sp. (in: high G+C Gram-positive bacteria)]MDV8054702.1 hypothetical protein [Rhodococcus sp. IEGM 1343]OZE21073.1 hypothetical protein CH256_23025 [Rhodococcus sp. 05-2254-6]
MNQHAAHDRAAEYKAARRAVAREHHPDIGGDPARYMAALADVDRRFAVLPSAPVNAASTPTAFRASSIPSPLRTLPKRIARIRKRVTRRNYFEL